MLVIIVIILCIVFAPVLFPVALFALLVLAVAYPFGLTYMGIRKLVRSRAQKRNVL